MQKKQKRAFIGTSVCYPLVITEPGVTTILPLLVGTQDIVIRRTLHLLTLVDSMANDQSPRGVDEMTNCKYL